MFDIGASSFAVAIGFVGALLHNVHTKDQSENCKPRKAPLLRLLIILLLETIIKINGPLSVYQADLVSINRVNARSVA